MSNSKNSRSNWWFDFNKIADKITSVSKKPAKELHNNDETKEDVEITAHRKNYISPEERQIIEELRLIPKKDAYFYKLLMN